jgi:hypothetical protein
MKDDIRPRGTVQVQCHKCTWHFWVGALDARLPDGPFECDSCEKGLVFHAQCLDCKAKAAAGLIPGGPDSKCACEEKAS